MRQLLHRGRIDGQAQVHGALHLLHQRRPLHFDLAPVLEDAPEFGSTEVLAIRGHERQRFQPVAHVGLGTGHQAVAHQRQTVAQLVGLGDLQIQCVDLALDDAARFHAFACQQIGNVAQGQAHEPHGLDAMQTLHIGLAVEAVAAAGAARRFEQADFVVMVQRAHRQAGAARQFTDLQQHEGATQRLTASSSISKFSVALGGITPPAPRSP